MISADQIEQALITTTQDIGNAGKDNLYGHGLVQAKAAYLYLQKQPAPCGGFAISNEALASSTAFKERQRRKKLGVSSSGVTTRKNSNLRHRRHQKRMLQNDEDGMNVLYNSDNTTSYSSGYPVSHRQHTTGSVFVDI